MQLVEAVILLFVGLVPGVWATLVDVYTVGASAFATRIALLILLVVLLATNARYRRQAAWGSAWLSLGCVESYYLSSSYTFAGLARSTVAPLALLSVAAAGMAWVSWTAKHERGAFGLALKVLVLVVTLVACVATHDGLGALDVVCVLAIAYCLFFMRSRRVAIVRHDPRLDAPNDEVASSAARGASRARAPRRPASAAPTASEASTRRRAASGSSRILEAVRHLASGQTERRAPKETSRRPAKAGRTTSSTISAPTERSSRQEGRTITTLQLKRSARPVRASSSRASRSGASPASAGSRDARGTAPATAKGTPRSGRPSAQGSGRATGHPKSRQRARSGQGSRSQQRPTKRTGGAVPEANRMRSSSADAHGRSAAKPHRRADSGPRRHR